MLLGAFSLPLGIEYSESITAWGKRKDKDDPVGSSARLCYYVDGNAVEIPKKPALNHRAIYDMASMYEKGYDSDVAGGMLKNRERQIYLVDGYETPVDATVVNGLFIEEVLKSLAYTEVCVGVRSYFDREQSEKVGMSFYPAFRTAKIRTVPETLCVCVASAKNLEEDGTYNILVVSLAGTRTVFALYKATIAGEKRGIETLLHSDFELISDSLVRRIIYKHILRGLEAAVKETEVGEGKDRNVTFYPKQPGTELFDNYADISSLYKAVVADLNDGMVDRHRSLEIDVRNGEGKTQFQILGAFVEVAEIRKEIWEVLIEANKDMYKAKMKEITRAVKEKIGDESYTTLLKSDFSDNRDISSIFTFENIQPTKPNGVSIGAAYIADDYFSVADPLVVEIRGDYSATEGFREELRTRKRYLEVSAALREDLEGGAFSYLKKEDCKKLLDLFQQEKRDLVTMRRINTEYERCKKADEDVERGKSKRDPILREFESTIKTVESMGDKEGDEWVLFGMLERIREARVFLETAKKDKGILGNKIEEALLDLVSEKNRFLRRRDRRLKEEEKKAEEAAKETETKTDGAEEEVRDIDGPAGKIEEDVRAAEDLAEGGENAGKKAEDTGEKAEDAGEEAPGAEERSMSETKETAEDLRDEDKEVTGKTADQIEEDESEGFEFREEEQRAFEEIFGSPPDFDSELESTSSERDDVNGKLKQESVNQTIKDEL
jgi:hypothetical protein